MANKKVVIDITSKDKTKAGLAKSEKSLKSFASSMGPLIAGAFGVAALAGAANKFIDINKEFQKMNASLITMTGSAENADAAFKEIAKFAKTTPFQLNQSVQAFIKLKALGLDPSMEALRSYGNTASAMGKDLNQMIEAVADATTGEFERLKEFGIKSKSEGDKVSFTFQGVTTKIGKNAKEISKFLQGIGDINFAGAMEMQMKTLGGAISNLQDSWDDLFRKMGEDSGLSDQLTESINGLSEAISNPAFVAGLTSVASVLADIAKGAADAFTNVSASVRLAEEWDAAFKAGEIDSSTYAKGQFGLVDRRQKLEEAAYDRTFNRPGITFQAPQRPAALPSAPSAAGGDDIASKPFAGFGGVSIWEMEAQSAMALEKLMEFNANKFELAIADGEQMQDLWLMNSDARVEAETRGIEMIMQKEADLQAQKQQVWKATSSAFMNITNAMYVAGGKQSKKMFELNQAAGIADATVNTFIAANKTWAQWGYPWGIPMVAAVVAGGLANVSSIASQSFGGGGTAAAAGGTGGGTPSSPIVTQPVQQEQVTQQRSITINIIGDVVDHDKFARDLIPSITKAINDGVT